MYILMTCHERRRYPGPSIVARIAVRRLILFSIYFSFKVTCRVHIHPALQAIAWAREETLSYNRPAHWGNKQSWSSPIGQICKSFPPTISGSVPTRDPNTVPLSVWTAQRAMLMRFSPYYNILSIATIYYDHPQLHSVLILDYGI